MKALLALVPLLAMSLAASTESGLPADAHPEIVQVSCLTGAGSAFRIGPHLIVSANHVTSLSLCSIGSERTIVVDVSGDFSLVKSEIEAPYYLKVDCDGFRPGRKYKALGYARGLKTLTEVDLTGTGLMEGQFSLLSGVFTVIPGQSGGPVLDAETGSVVGIVNVFNMQAGLSGSIALKDTPVCATP